MWKLTAVVGCLFALGLLTSAQEKKDPKSTPKAAKIEAGKIVGKWKLTEAPDPKSVGAIFRFEKEKVVFTATSNGKSFDFNGTYKIVGDQLKITMEGVKEEDDPITINKLTESELVITGKDGKKAVFAKQK